jgi:hypothetical protein
MRFTLAASVVLLASATVGCAHRAETVVHLSAPNAAGWTVREPRGAEVCTLPCSVELDDHETLIVHHSAGKQFVIEQDTLGKGVWSGSVRPRKELGRGAIFLQTLSTAVGMAGERMTTSRDDGRAATGIVLVAAGAAGVALADALPGKTVEELRLEKIARE